MTTTNLLPLVTVDIGNTRVKFADFELTPAGGPLPHPTRALSVGVDWTDTDLEQFLPRQPADYAWWIASVNRPATARLVQWLQTRKVDAVHVLTHADLPLAVEVARPDLVGIDRLANAVGANKLRQADQQAIAIDFGTAITVDVVSATGAFVGGAILPGVAMAARALNNYTDLLPLVEVTEPPAPLGTSTTTAIASGLYWGAVGAVRELVSRLVDERGPAQIFLTGGAAPPYVAILREQTDVPPQFVPHLTLWGIALAAIAPKAAAKDAR
jgi:type III pantothenate kinase